MRCTGQLGCARQLVVKTAASGKQVQFASRRGQTVAATVVVLLLAVAVRMDQFAWFPDLQCVSCAGL